MPARRSEDDPGDLDLIPIMNMVLILIPLLLLSVVFVELTVIDVSLAKIGQATNTPPPKEDPPPKVEIMIEEKGFTIRVNKKALAPIGSCTEGGKQTICTDENAKKADVPTSAYRWLELYNLAVSLKRGENPDYPNVKAWAQVDSIDFILNQDIKFAVLIKAMDTLRFMRCKEGDKACKGDTFDKIEDFNKSTMAKGKYTIKGEDFNGPIPLFRNPMLGQPVFNKN